MNPNKNIKKLEICKQFAIKEHNGLCLSDEYITSQTKMLWECEKGHQWLAVWASIKHQRSWCPKCIGRSSPSIKELQDFAISKNGKLISTIYSGNKSKLLWECENKHEFEMNWNDASGGHWCSKCFHVNYGLSARYDINEIQQYAIDKGGRLISTSYTNNLTNMLWECKEGHQWEATWLSVKNHNTWCLRCSGKAIYEIEELQDYAKSKNGKLKSTEYINNHTKLEWECESLHNWWAQWSDIKNKNTWCPNCSSLKTEKICREIIEKIFNKPFPQYRFKNKEDNTFIWDGYNEELNIAFEYHGIQHYEFPNYFHRTEDDFIMQIERDNDKGLYAEENGIKLIIIPYTENYHLEEYIYERLKNINCLKEEHNGTR